MLLYHYTSLKSAINIIRNDLCFWGFRYDTMNDPTDFVFARDLVIPKILEEKPEYSEENDFNVYPYIVSFCMERDHDIMWRLYHGEVALVIESDKFPIDDWQKEGDIANNIGYNEVIYATEETIEEAARQLYENRIGIFQDDILTEYQLYVTPFIKHKAYEIEREYRLTRLDYDSIKFSHNAENPKKPYFYEGEIPKGIKCLGEKDGLLRFYKEFQLPKECLVGLILHTFDDKKFQIQKQHFELWLQQNEFPVENIKIEQSRSYPVR